MYELRSVERGTFDFSIDGTEWSVPSYDTLSLDQVEGFATAHDNAAAEKALRGFFEDAAPGCTEGLLLREFMSLVKAWQHDSGVTAGESAPSSE